MTNYNFEQLKDSHFYNKSKGLVSAGLAGILLASSSQNAHALQSLDKDLSCEPGESFEVVSSEVGYGALSDDYQHFIIRTCENVSLDGNYIREGVNNMKVSLEIDDHVPERGNSPYSFGKTFFEKDKITPYAQFGGLGTPNRGDDDYKLNLHFNSEYDDNASYTHILKGEGEIHVSVRLSDGLTESDDSFPARGRVSWGKNEDGSREENRYSLPIFGIRSPASLNAKEYLLIYSK